MSTIDDNYVIELLEEVRDQYKAILKAFEEIGEQPKPVTENDYAASTPLPHAVV